jgi:23S rRNA (uracil1939-C5)-methyltransferase
MRPPPQLVLVDVEGLDPSDDGAAYGSVSGRRVRTDWAIPGEQVEVRLTEDGGGNLVGEVVRIVRPSEHRVTPRCPYFGRCGGCAWQHIAYPEQLRLKERLLQQLLRQSIGAAAPPVRRMLAGEGDEWGFRNKVHFVFAPAAGGHPSTALRTSGGPPPGCAPGMGGHAHRALRTSHPALRAGGLVLGHYRRGSQAVIEVDQCAVHANEGNRVAFAVRDALANARIDGANPDGGRGIARHIVVRVTGRQGRANTDNRANPADQETEVLATLVVSRNDKRLRPAMRAITGGAGAPDGLALNVNSRPGPYLFGDETRHLHGRRRVRERVAGVSFLISATAFFQTNVRAAEAMVRHVLEQAGDARTALDLYAGAGLFALPLAMRGVRVVAVEENAEAVEDGEASRRFNRIPESACAFVRARAEDVAQGGHRRAIPASADVVVLDPPRAGCPPPVLDWVCGSLHPRRIIYVSCNPQALAQDVRMPIAAGYTLQMVQPIDMFPHTAHIETVAVLGRSL